MNHCQRDGCNEPLKTGKHYCSPKCAALAREDKKRELESTATSLERTIKEQYPLVHDIMLEDGVVEIPYPAEVRTMGDLVLSYDGKEEYRPEDMLSWEAIERMRKSGPVVFAMEMKRARLLSVFADGRYVIDSPDKELAEVAMAGLRTTLPRIANDMTYSSFIWGVSFQEQVWQRMSKYELGLSNSRSGASEFVVPKVFASVNPRSVTKIFRKNGSFDGFEQQAPLGMNRKSVRVAANEALVVPFREEFRRLWGPSFLEPLYPIWITYERVLRAMIRYMDRMAVPIAVGKAPSKGMTQVPGTTGTGGRVQNLQYALTLALSIAKSNAVAIPSDVDEDGNALWSLEYLMAESRQQSFIDVLEFLTQEMLRAALSADRALSQSSGGVGSYNIGEIHAEASSAAAEMLLINFVHYLNKYFMPYFATYNRGSKAPPIYLKTQPVTTREQAILMTLLQQGANSPSGQDFFNWVDWKGLSETSNIPILAEGEQFKPPKPPKPEAPKPQVVQDTTQIDQAQQKALEGGYITISREDIASAMREVIESQRPFELENPNFDEGKVKRDAGGRFSTKNSTKSSDDARRMESISLDLQKHVRDGTLSQEEADRLLSLARYSLNMKSRLNGDQDIVAMLRDDFGYEGKLNIVDNVASEKLSLLVSNMLTGSRTDAFYDQSSGEIFISRATAAALQDGSLEALEIVAHEAMHARQGGADRMLGPGEVKVFNKIVDLAGLNPLGATSVRVGHTEGINQLATLRQLSQTTGVQLSSGTLETAARMVSDSRYRGDMMAETYPSQTAYAANLVSEIADTTGKSLADVLDDLHSHGDDYPYQAEQISTVYSGWTWPSMDQFYENTGRDYGTGISAIERILQ